MEKLHKNVSKCPHLQKTDIATIHVDITKWKTPVTKYIYFSAWAWYVEYLENSNGICFSTLLWKPYIDKKCDKMSPVWILAIFN